MRPLLSACNACKSRHALSYARNAFVHETGGAPSPGLKALRRCAAKKTLGFLRRFFSALARETRPDRCKYNQDRASYLTFSQNSGASRAPAMPTGEAPSVAAAEIVASGSAETADRRLPGDTA
jgi:hypothetical protein